MDIRQVEKGNKAPDARFLPAEQSSFRSVPVQPQNRSLLLCMRGAPRCSPLTAWRRHGSTGNHVSKYQGHYNKMPKRSCGFGEIPPMDDASNCSNRLQHGSSYQERGQLNCGPQRNTRGTMGTVGVNGPEADLLDV